MKNAPASLLSICCYGLFFLFSSLAPADAVFRFDDIAPGTAAPLTSTVNGLSLTVTGFISACDTNGTFALLSGTALVQFFCSGPQYGTVDLLFSQPLSAVTFQFATAGVSAGTLNVQTFLDNAQTGSSNFSSAVPPGLDPNGEGTATLTGSFNRLALSTGSFLAVDNLSATVTPGSAVPEPALFGLLATGLLFLVGLQGLRKHGP